MEFPLAPVDLKSWRSHLKDSIVHLANHGINDYTGFKYVWDLLIEDSCLDEGIKNNNSDSIGIYFIDAQEAEAVTKVVALIDHLYMDDDDFDENNPTEHPEWSQVIQAAQEALLIILQAERFAYFHRQTVECLAQAVIEGKAGSDWALKQHKQKEQNP